MPWDSRWTSIHLNASIQLLCYKKQRISKFEVVFCPSPGDRSVILSNCELLLLWWDRAWAVSTSMNFSFWIGIWTRASVPLSTDWPWVLEIFHNSSTFWCFFTIPHFRSQRNSDTWFLCSQGSSHLCWVGNFYKSYKSKGSKHLKISSRLSLYHFHVELDVSLSNSEYGENTLK